MIINKDTHPKSYKFIGDYLLGEMGKQQSLTQEMITSIPLENAVDVIIKTNARVLFDALDNIGMYISISYTKSGWKFRIDGAVPMEGSGGKNRLETEDKVFKIALDKIEQR